MVRGARKWDAPDDFIGLDDKASDSGREEEEEEEEESQEEVFSLDEYSSGSDGEEGEEDEEDEALDQEESAPSANGKKMKKGVKSASSGAGSDGSEEEEEDEGWGTRKSAYYSGNAIGSDVSGSEDEDEANEMEEREARRLQAKARSGMTEEDFGLGDELTMEDDSAERKERREEGGAHDNDVIDLVDFRVGDDPVKDSGEDELGGVDRFKGQTTIALAGEYADMVEQLEQVEESLKKRMAEDPEHSSLSLMHLHHQTLLTYTTTLAFYFHLRSTPRFASTPSLLSSHPIMSRLLQLKLCLSQMEDLDLAGASSPESSLSDESEADELGWDEDTDSLGRTSPISDPEDGKYELAASDEDEDDDEEGLDPELLGQLDKGELETLLADEKAGWTKEDALAVRETWQAQRALMAKASGKKRKRGAETAKDEDGTVEIGSSSTSKKQKKNKNKNKSAEKKLLDLSSLDSEPAPDFASSSRTKSKKRATAHADGEGVDEDAAAYGDPTSLSAADAQDKSARRKSLRFYTSQIDSKAAKRDAARAERLNGDMDIPYRDRERSRMAVMRAQEAKAAKERERRGGKDKSADLDAEEWGEEDRKAARSVLGGGAEDDDDADGGDDGYYDLVKSTKARSKKKKKEEYEAAVEAQRITNDPLLTSGEHRSINRMIEKNRGLTPRRAKEVRNPRVKKRMRYDKAKKKVATMRPVYKGGQSALEGGYAGEKSGISANLVKSVKFA